MTFSDSRIKAIKSMARENPQHVFERVLSADLRGHDGRNHTGLCPFHKEGTPSFKVGVKGGDYAGYGCCFACNTKGDIIALYQKRASCDFKKAIDDIAKILGIT